MTNEEIEELFGNVAAGNLDAVREFLITGDPNIRYSRGSLFGGHSIPLVVHAAANGQRAIVELLREKGTDMTAVVDPANPVTADQILIEVETEIAARHARQEAKAAEIAAKAAEAVAYETTLPLFRAVVAGDRQTIKTFLDSGGNPNIRAPFGDYSIPLVVHAAANGQKAIVEMLRARGADMTAVANHEHPVTADAALGESTAKKIGRDAKAAEVAAEKATLPLFGKVVARDPQAIRKFLDSGGDPDIRAPFGDYSIPLVVHAAIHGQKAAVELLRKAGADMTAVADHANPITASRILMKQKAKEEEADAYKTTPPLFSAIVAGNRKTIETFLNSGGNPNIRAPFGKHSIPLVVHAAARGQKAIVELLRERGANMEAVVDPENPITADQILGNAAHSGAGRGRGTGNAHGGAGRR